MKPLNIAILLFVLWIISPTVFKALEEFILTLIKLATVIVGNVQLPIGTINLP